jgi:hypothetical protein
MKILALLRLVLLQPLLTNGVRHYSPDTPMVIVADVCGKNSKDLSQAYRARSVANVVVWKSPGQGVRFYLSVNSIACSIKNLI